MSHFKKLDSLLKDQAVPSSPSACARAYAYAQSMAAVENVIAVVSDLAQGSSRIFNGGFADTVGLKNYCSENSIWEKKILSLMPPGEQEQKFIAELRFFHYLRHIGPARKNCYLMSKLRFLHPDGSMINILHRMYYVYHDDGSTILYAICLYGPLSVDFKGTSIVVNSVTGTSEELTSVSHNDILSHREQQVLALIDTGLKSRDIAARLNISIHTVSRHRQEILAKLQVKSSIEACRLARSMQII